MADPTDMPPNGSTLTVDERLQATSLAQDLAHRLKPLKQPLRRAVMEKVKWILGEE